MQKTITIIVVFVLIGIVGTFFAINKPYEPTSFVVDGENFSASIQEGAIVVLTLDNEKGSKKWSITSTPEAFASDYNNTAETCTEFHIIALNDGDGTMTFQALSDGGKTEAYQLELSISRHKKIHLQIDSISFTELKQA